MDIVVLIALVISALALLPAWSYSSGWGYYPSGGLGLVVAILVVLLLMGKV